MGKRVKQWCTLGAAAVLAAGSVPACASGDAAAGPDTAEKPNIISFVVDDMSADLLKYMDATRGLGEGGTTFDNYVISNSLCCPSRASMFTGQFPHNTGVLTNGGKRGGYEAFKEHEPRTYATALREEGYRTGYLGKYINGYKFDGADFHVPDGWSEWHVADGGGYSEYDYNLTDYTGGEKSVSDGEGKYLVDVMAQRSVDFLERSRAEQQPFFLQVAPFSPHSKVKNQDGPRFPAAKRDRPGGEFPHGDCGGVDCHDIDPADVFGPSWDEDTGDKPSWVRKGELTEKEKRKITTSLRDRVRMVQSVDDMVEKVSSKLTDEERRNTYIAFHTDNGFHLGQHRLLSGKSTAYDHDVKVPLIVKRPEGSGEQAEHRRELAQNVDMYSTYLDIAGADDKLRDSRDGRSLLPLINGDKVADWRDAALVEHVKPGKKGAGPDKEPRRGNAQPPTYDAIRTADDLLVRYRGVDEPEYYDLGEDPHQLTNKPDDPRARALTTPLRELASCGQSGKPTCWDAADIG